MAIALMLAPTASFAQYTQPPSQASPSLSTLSPSLSPQQKQPWVMTPSIGVLETATNNVDLKPRDQQQSDLVTTITPSLFVNGRGEHTSLTGNITVPVVLYARTGAENNNVYPQVNLLGDVALFDKFLHIQGAVSVQQQFFTPFGPQPSSLSNATQNRYRTATYTVSPYIEGRTAGGVVYELRNINSWTNLSDAPEGADNTRYYEVRGAASNLQARWGWRANFDYSNIIFTPQNEVYTRLIRVEPVYNATPQLQLSARVGYEDNEYTFTSSRDTIYGAGLEWRPTDRTRLIADWEHRFFGASYLLDLNHRTPLSIWNVRVSRNITTYPSQLAALTPGVSVLTLVNELFQSQYPDPVERQRFVDQFIRDRGLPSILADPVLLYGEQIQLEELQTASVGLVGARNTILFTLFNLRSEPIAGSGAALPPLLAANSSNTQTGGQIVWTHTLTPKLLLTGSVQGSRTSANAPFSGTTNQGIANLVLSTPLSPHTTVYGGTRYQALSSDVSPDYHEAAVFVGLQYFFR